MTPVAKSTSSPAEPVAEPIVVDEHGDDAAAVDVVEVTVVELDVVEDGPMPSVEADPTQHAVAMPSLLADGTPEHPEAVVLITEDDPRAVHFEG